MSFSTSDVVERVPESITYGKGLTMTFLHNEPWGTKNHFSGDPDADILYVPPHWHETHDEVIRVAVGVMEIMLGSSTRRYTPEDGDVLIPRGVVHSLRTIKGTECTFYEKTDPMDGEKEIFFRNMFGKGQLPGFFDAVMACYSGDTMPGFPGHFMWFEKFFVTLFGGYLAPLLGYKRKYQSLKDLD